MDMVNEAFAEQVNGLEIVEVCPPEADQVGYMTICRPEAMEAIVDAGLLPFSTDDATDAFAQRAGELGDA